MTAALWDALREIDDPEMPVNLVDLGLIYAIENDQGAVTVDLTFTAMGCPAADMIVSDISERLLREPGVHDVKVNVVWDPPWTVARMTKEGKECLEMWGLAV